MTWTVRRTEIFEVATEGEANALMNEKIIRAPNDVEWEAYENQA